MRAPSQKAIFICRVMEGEKYPKEETSYYFVPKRLSYRSKVMHEEQKQSGSSSTKTVNMKIGTEVQTATTEVLLL